MARTTGTNRMPAARMVAGIVSAPGGLGSAGKNPSASNSATDVVEKPTNASERPPKVSDMLGHEPMQPLLEHEHGPTARQSIDRDCRRRLRCRNRAGPFLFEPVSDWQHESALRAI